MFMRFVGSALLIELVVQSLIVLVIVILNWENSYVCQDSNPWPSTSSPKASFLPSSLLTCQLIFQLLHYHEIYFRCKRVHNVGSILTWLSRVPLTYPSQDMTELTSYEVQIMQGCSISTWAQLLREEINIYKKYLVFTPASTILKMLSSWYYISRCP